MRCYWEKMGFLGPIYRLVGRGLSDRDIAKKLGITEVNVHSCISWLLHFLRYDNRSQLVLRAGFYPSVNSPTALTEQKQAS